MSSLRCPQCDSRKHWILKDGRRRCARCRFDWRPGRLPLRLTPREWRSLLRWFVRGVSSALITHETGLERKRVLRALTVVRQAMALCIPPAFRRAFARDLRSMPATAERPRPKATRSRAPRSPVLGLSMAHGQAWAEVVSDAQAEELRPVLPGRKPAQPIERPAMSRYAAVVYRGRFYRLADAGTEGSSARFGELEAFWAYLRRQLRGKGGIRLSRLGLYLAEYAWRYNNRRLGPAEQLRELFKLIRRAPRELGPSSLARQGPSP